MKSGARYANGVKVGLSSLKPLSGYIPQNDMFLGSLTVREHLTFQACVRMDRNITYKQRMERVETVVDMVRISYWKISVLFLMYSVKKGYFV